MGKDMYIVLLEWYDEEFDNCEQESRQYFFDSVNVALELFALKKNGRNLVALRAFIFTKPFAFMIFHILMNISLKKIVISLHGLIAINILKTKSFLIYE